MSAPIRVLHVIDKFSMDGVNPSSCSRLFAAWIPRHDPARFHVEVAGLRPPDDAGRFLEAQGIAVHYITRGKFSPANIEAICTIAAAGGFHVLHLHGYSSANFGRLAAKKLGIPSIVHEHAILRVLPHQFLIDRLLRNKTDVAIAVSTAVKEFMIRGRSIPAEKIRVIWNGIALEAFQNISRARVAAVREKWGISRQARIVGTITRLREEKGNRFLLDAALSLRDKYPEVYFVLVGDGPLKPELQRQVRESGLADRVVFAGFVSDVPPALAAFDIAVVPSLREGFGLALAEAMAAGKPSVATAVGGLTEIARPGVSALFVPPGDGEALAREIGRLLADPELASNIAAGARADCQKFSIENNVGALEKLYEELYAGARAGTAPAVTHLAA